MYSYRDGREDGRAVANHKIEPYDTETVPRGSRRSRDTPVNIPSVGPEDGCVVPLSMFTSRKIKPVLVDGSLKLVGRGEHGSVYAATLHGTKIVLKITLSGPAADAEIHLAKRAGENGHGPFLHKYWSFFDPKDADISYTVVAISELSTTLQREFDRVKANPLAAGALEWATFEQGERLFDATMELFSASAILHLDLRLGNVGFELNKKEINWLFIDYDISTSKRRALLRNGDDSEIERIPSRPVRDEFGDPFESREDMLRLHETFLSFSNAFQLATYLLDGLPNAEYQSTWGPLQKLESFVKGFAMALYRDYSGEFPITGSPEDSWKFVARKIVDSARSMGIEFDSHRRDDLNEEEIEALSDSESVDTDESLDLNDWSDGSEDGI